ncbi:hypothetical protein KRR40_12130 [Niabella defluvii]|nr:hypothetical protein KRR40_12130 [Niabella sp. I65]
MSGKLAIAQNRVYTYYLNAQLESVPKEKAVITGKGRTLDSVYLVQYYKMSDNRLLWFEQFKDSTLAVLHGDRVLYHPNRKVERKAILRTTGLTAL